MHAPARILALDLATTTGWALHAAGVLTSGSQDFARYKGSSSRAAEHVGEPFAKFGRWVRERIRDDKPTVIVYERSGFFKSMAAVDTSKGLRGVLLAYAAAYGVRVECYAPSQVKLFWTGSGRAKKPEMIAATLARAGVRAVDDNESDAIALLELHRSKAAS